MTTARYHSILRTIPFLIVACLFSFPAYAKYGGGTGEPNDPYQIATAEDMSDIGNHEEDWDKHFVLVNDIDLSAYPGTQFNIIGRWFGWNHPDTKGFSGVFDGNGKVIRNFTWSSIDRDSVGLFAVLNWNAPPYHRVTVKNLGLEEVNIRAENGFGVGALVAHNGARITNCYVTGAVSGQRVVGGLVGGNHQEIISCRSLATVEGDDYIGGLAGSHHNGDIECSSSQGAVSGNRWIGGLVGTSSEADITYCYSNSMVCGKASVGGLVGSNSTDADIIDCYARGNVSGTARVGGLVGVNADTEDGQGEIIRCYSSALVQGQGDYIGGLVGLNEASINCSFWDRQASGMGNMCGGEPYYGIGCDDSRGKTSAEMQTARTFFGWGQCDQEVTWTIDEGNDYPRLWWEDRAGAPIVVTLSGLLTGSGTEDDPYLIYTAEELNLAGLFPCDFNKHFKLMADIDLSAYAGAAFNIIGEASHFCGVFDGNGHTISNFSYSGPRTARVGLFGYVSNAVIGNLGLIDLDIDVATADEVGALVGFLRSGTLVNCYVCGGSVCGDDSVGGLVGLNEDGTIMDCYAAISVFGERRVGGLVGYNDSDDGRSIVESCYTAADVTGADGARDLGGLVGRSSGSIIKDCYAIGSVTVGASSDCVGGLVGTNWGTVAHCYSAARISAGDLSVNLGGLVGLRWGRYVIASYWDVDTSGLTISAGGDGKTTAEMQTASTFIGWGCEPTVWTIDEGVDYPRLDWEDKPGDALPTLSEFLAGSGTQADPYLIHTADELNMIGLFPCAWNKRFKLMDDIDLAGFAETDFNIIGYYITDDDNKPFTGIFDGNGKRISNFSYACTDTDYIGLFRYVYGGSAEVKDLGLVDPNVDAGEGGYVGSLVGCLEEDGAVTGCYVQSGSVSGDYFVGGLVGRNSEGIISNCYATSSVSGRWRVGGLVGDNGNYATITNCYSTGSVMATGDVGGLVGGIGSNAVITNSFWDTETSAQAMSAGGDGKTTAEMQTASTYLNAGWDFIGETANGTEDIWAICEGVDYPHLAWQFVIGDFDSDADTDLADFRILAEHWLAADGSFWCGQGCDLTNDGSVNWQDLMVFAEKWSR